MALAQPSVYPERRSTRGILSQLNLPTPLRLRLSTFVFVVSIATPLSVYANGYGESSPWQFPTPNAKSVSLTALDVIERKKGGYYDGFSTTIHNSSVSNVGTQINCNIVADATANRAQMGQNGNSSLVEPESNLLSSSTGNESLTGTDSGSGSADTAQTNNGTLNSNVDGSSVTTTTGRIVNGSTDNKLENTQSNTGNQLATVDESVACAMDGSQLTGNVSGNFTGQTLTGPLN
jgi:hypothetical protein